MTAYGFKKNKCKEEVYTKDEIDKSLEAISNDVIKCKLKGDFAVLTGNMTLEANTGDNASEGICTDTELVIDYPEGFSADNCVVLSAGRKGTSNCYSYGWNNTVDSVSMVLGLEPFAVSLYGETSNDFSNKIRLMAGNLATNSKTISYKVVLMKV